jgi:hypothetical protein
MNNCRRQNDSHDLSQPRQSMIPYRLYCWKRAELTDKHETEYAEAVFI